MSDEVLSLFYPLSRQEIAYLNGEDKGMPYVENLTLRAEQLLHDGKMIDVRPNYRFLSAQTHRHDYIEMAYVLHGKLSQIIEGKKLVMTAGDLLILNLHARHSVERCEKDDIMINIVIRPEFFDRALKLSGLEDSPMRRFFVNCILDKDDRPDYLLFHVGDVLPIRNLLDNLLWSIKNEVAYKQSTNQLTVALLLRLLQFHAGGVSTDEQSTDAIWQVQQYIEARYVDGDLEDAARMLNYDYRSLSREIVRKTGKTFTDLMQERRLQQAMYFLKNTDYPVTEICDRVGYKNPTFFYKIFKARFGATPREYRKNRS